MGNLLRLVSRRPAGAFIFIDDRGETSMDTTACVHCHAHWVIQPGSGRERGYCMNCSGPTCGGAGCDTCVPYEKSIEAIEHAARMEANMRAIRGVR